MDYIKVNLIKMYAVVKSRDVPICNFLAICRELILLVDFLSLVSILLENPKGNP